MEVKKISADEKGNLLPFYANGTMYTPISPESGITVSEWKEFEKLQIALGFGRSFSDLADTLKQIELTAASDKPFAEIRTEVILLTNSLRKSIVAMSAERNHIGLVLASLFIRRGEQKWSHEVAEASIRDWEAESIDVTQLFFFALSLVKGFKDHYQSISKALMEEADKLASFGFKEDHMKT